MGKIQVEIRASFGKLVLEGSTAEEVLDTLASLPEDFLRKIEAVVSDKISSDKDRTLDNIVKFTEMGPILIIKDSRALTHYEAVGLILYFSENRINRPSQIRQLLEYSGMMNIQVSSRLNEMAKRGLVYKPTSGRSEWVLSPKGECWIRDEVLPKLRGLS